MANIREFFRDFTLANLAGAIYQSWRVIVAGVALGVLALGAWVGYDWYQSRRDGEASLALIKASAEIRKQQDTKGRDEAAIKLFRLVSEQHPGTHAGGEALIRLGHRLYDAGKYDEARDAFGKYVQDYSRGPLRTMAGIGKAYAEEAKGDLGAAEKTLLAAIDGGKDDPLFGEAKLGLARIYEGLKKTDDAVKIYEQLAEKFPQTHWGQYALERMASLRAK